MTGPRLIAVCGYSSGDGEGLHEICEQRLRRAEQEARPDDVVLLTGWARGRSAASEAELMARSWRAPCRQVLVDSVARSTLANVAAIASVAREVGSRRIVLVTSSWHAGRASALLRAALRGSGSTVEIAASDDPASLPARLRELVCWALVPYALRARPAAPRPRRSPHPAGGAPESQPGRGGR
jgi:uncharacterized SAM-binding protein YcdF (DUF218 family)